MHKANIEHNHYLQHILYEVIVIQLLGLPRLHNLLLIVCDHINTIYAIIQRLFGQNKRRQ